MKRYFVTHETSYSYGAPVDLGLHMLRMTPVSSDRQMLVEHNIKITPEPTRSVTFRDHFGNDMQHVALEAPHQSFSVILHATVDVAAIRDVTAISSPAWEDIRDQMQGDGFPMPAEVAEFAYASPLAPREEISTDYGQLSFPRALPIIRGLQDLTQRIYTDFTYAPGTTDISTPVPQIMASRSGVCQDFAHVMIACLRGIGLPARYVSGYLRTYPPEAPGGWRGADASHAWVSAWCGRDIGWLEFDPTNNLIVQDEHISLAYGRDFSDVTPLRGVILGGGQHTLSVAVKVVPLTEP